MSGYNLTKTIIDQALIKIKSMNPSNGTVLKKNKSNQVKSSWKNYKHNERSTMKDRQTNRCLRKLDPELFWEK